MMRARIDAGKSERSPAWLVPLFGLAAVVLAPWAVILGVVLPSTHQSAHWDIAWAGFDVALALVLCTVAVTAWRRSLWLEGAASAAATLLFVDAWFDILTSSSHSELFVASGEAAFAELPLAVLCLLVARSARRNLQRGAGARRSADAPTGEAPANNPIRATALHTI